MQVLDLKRLGFVFLALCLAGPAAAESAYPDLAPMGLAVELSVKDEPFPVEALIEAALVFSGDPDIEAEKRMLMEAVQEFQRQVTGIRDETRLGEAALAYLHAKFLRAYSPNQMRVDAAVNTGVFNCLSSAVLYFIFARSAGLSVKGILTPDHAFCSVGVDEFQIDVETTNPYGFNPGTKKEFKDLFGKTTGYSYVPASNYSNRRSIGEKEFLGRILYDRASLEIQKGNYLAAVGPAVSAYALNGTEEFRRARTAALSNYAVSLGMRRRYDDALSFLNAVESAFGGIAELEQRREDISHNRIVDFLESGRFDDAEAVLGSNAPVSGLKQDDWLELSIFAVQKRAEAAAVSGGYSKAIAVVEEGITRLGRDPILLKTYQSYVHNRFAALFNARKFLEARSALLPGLTLYPESAAFAQDLRIVEQALKE